MKELIGCWRTVDEVFRGLEYHFRPDGSFEMQLAELDLRAAGRYRIRAEHEPFEIDIHFVQHSRPEALGVSLGTFKIENGRLRMKVAQPSSERHMDPGAWLTYDRADCRCC